MKKFFKITAWTIGSIVVLLLVLMAAIPPFARGYVNNHGEELCGRRIYVDNIDLNLFGGHLGVDSLNLYEQDGQNTFVKVGNLDVNLAIYQLLSGTIDIESISVDRLFVNVEQNGDQFNFSDIIAFFDTDEPQDTTSSSLPLVLEDIRLSNSEVCYKDVKIGSNFDLNDIQLHIPFIDLEALKADVDLSLKLAQGGALKLIASYDDGTGDFDLDTQVRHLQLHSIFPYLRQSMNATDLKGLFDAQTTVKGNLNHILALQVQGQTCVSKFQLDDASGQPCISADSLSLATAEVNLLKNRYGISYIYLNNPDFHIVIGSDSIDNISRMLTTAVIDQQEEDDVQQPDSLTSASPAIADSTEKIGEEPFDLYIDKLAVSGGRLAYADHTLTYDPFIYNVGNINFEADTFRLSGINDIAISCAPGSGDGTIDLKYHGCFEDMHNMIVNLKVADVALKDFSPYVVQMFGNPLTGGTLSFDSDTKVSSGDIDSHNHLIIKQPKVEDKRKDVKPEIKAVPVKAGIYILTDKNGVCDMEVPVTGNIDEPKFSVKRLIFRTLGKLIVKVATSPFNGNKNDGGEGEASVAPTDSVSTAPVVVE